MTNNLYDSYQDTTKKFALRSVSFVMLLLVCAFVLIVAFGGSPQVVRAESSTVVDGDNTLYCDYGYTVNTPGTDACYFNGYPNFLMSYETFSNNYYKLPFDKTIVNADTASLRYVNKSVAFDNYFNFNFSTVFKFSQSNVTKNYIDFNVPTGYTYDFFVLLYSTGELLEDNYYCLNNKFLNDDSFVSKKYVIGSNKGIIPDADVYFSVYYDAMWQAKVSNTDPNYPLFDINLVLNTYNDIDCSFVLYSFKLPAGQYEFRGSSYNVNYSFVAGIWSSYVQNSDYKSGYDNGYKDGYDVGKSDGTSIGYDLGYREGYLRGQTQANNTVSDTSASYQAGYNKGVDSAGKYTFMSLISSVIDAPIRAFFGYKDADGVTHTGLFNLNILGYDMSALVLSLFSACVIIMIIKICLGGK